MGKDAVHRQAANLWGITSYFNPTRYRRRLINYRTFRERLSVPLVTVELAYGGDCELNENDAEILIQLHGHHVMWQKERLLNVALRALPNHCTHVISVDCDVIFEAIDWPEQLRRSLEHSVILQPFSHVHSLPRDCLPEEYRAEAAECHESICFAIATGVPPVICIGEMISPDGIYTYARGFTWAAQRQLLDRHGFYDACIIGNGDRAMAGAVYGCYNEVMQFQCMNKWQRARYLEWAMPFHESVSGRTGCMNGNVYHLWHGEMRDRHYRERHKILPRFEFDPFQDIAIDDDGCWRWNTDKPQMHTLVNDYFLSRNEDG
jgi:hypothetical protein